MKEKAVKINVKTNKAAASKDHEEGPVIEVPARQVPDPAEANNAKVDNGKVEESVQGLEISEVSIVDMVVEKAKDPQTPSIEVVGRVETEEGFDIASPVKIEVVVDLQDGEKANVSISVADVGEMVEGEANEAKELKSVTKGLEELNVKDKDE